MIFRKRRKLGLYFTVYAFQFLNAFRLAYLLIYLLTYSGNKVSVSHCGCVQRELKRHALA